MSDDGELRQETMTRFERPLPGPIERVWDHMTGSRHLAGWLGEGTIEPRQGGVVNISNGHIRGVLTRWKPPRLLAYTWNVFGPGDAESPYPESYLMFELTPDGKDVRLILTHRPILAGFEGLTRMGWHTFLDMLDARLLGRTPESRDVLLERNRVRYGVDKIPR